MIIRVKLALVGLVLCGASQLPAQQKPRGCAGGDDFFYRLGEVTWRIANFSGKEVHRVSISSFPKNIVYGQVGTQRAPRTTAHFSAKSSWSSSSVRLVGLTSMVVALQRDSSFLW